MKHIPPHYTEIDKSLYEMDCRRYPKKGCGVILFFLRCFRWQQNRKSGFIKCMLKIFMKIIKTFYCLEIPNNLTVGGGLYIGHPYCITINGNAILGENINIHKGVTIGQENRGRRRGAPTIGNNVWIGINSSIVGKITIGNDVLIAPNSYVNCDIPSHSVVLGNPCIIKSVENATDGYINFLNEDV